MLDNLIHAALGGAVGLFMLLYGMVRKSDEKSIDALVRKVEALDEEITDTSKSLASLQATFNEHQRASDTFIKETMVALNPRHNRE